MRFNVSNTLTIHDYAEDTLPTCEWDSYATDRAAAEFLLHLRTVDLEPRCPEIEL